MAREKTPGNFEAQVKREFDKLDATIDVVGSALLAEIERLRALLRQLPRSLGITERDIGGKHKYQPDSTQSECLLCGQDEGAPEHAVTKLHYRGINREDAR